MEEGPSQPVLDLVIRDQILDWIVDDLINDEETTKFGNGPLLNGQNSPKISDHLEPEPYLTKAIRDYDRDARHDGAMNSYDYFEFILAQPNILPSTYASNRAAHIASSVLSDFKSIVNRLHRLRLSIFGFIRLGIFLIMFVDNYF